jgi:hypothetical protein
MRIRPADPLPRWLRTLLRTVPWVPYGACFGFFCAASILSLQVVAFAPSYAASLQTWYNMLYFSASRGATLGAMSVPVAYLLFLPHTRMIKALIAVGVSTVFFGLVGLRWIGPIAPVSLSASFGFWGACAAIYQHDRRSRKGAGFQGYFS